MFYTHKLMIAVLALTTSLVQADPDPASAAKTAGGPDLAIEGSLNEILIGGGTGLAARTVTFRHRQLIMHPEWAIAGTAKGECKIQVMYKLTNMGDAPTGKSFSVQLLNNNKVVAEDQVEALAAGQSKEMVTHGLFTKGHNWFTIRIDPKNAVAEAIELNNDQKFDYTLSEKCSTAMKVRLPGKAAPKEPAVAKPAS